MSGARKKLNSKSLVYMKPLSFVIFLVTLSLAHCYDSTRVALACIPPISIVGAGEYYAHNYDVAILMSVLSALMGAGVFIMYYTDVSIIMKNRGNFAIVSWSVVIGTLSLISMQISSCVLAAKDETW